MFDLSPAMLARQGGLLTKQRSALVSARRCLGFLVLATLCACGGGGSNGDTGDPPPPAGVKSISGVALLGAISDANVEITGIGGSLGTGQTDVDGRFGPISYPQSYEGPLRIDVSAPPGGNASWICDAYLGCAINNALYQVGDIVPFDGTMSAMVPTAVDGQTVSVSLLSNMVAERVGVLGGLSEDNVELAEADIAATLDFLLGPLYQALGQAPPDSLTRRDLVDLGNPPAPSSADDAVNTLLSLFNASLIVMSVPGQSTGQFIEDLSRAVANTPELPVSSPLDSVPSREWFSTLLFFQLRLLQDSGDAIYTQLNELLAPATIETLDNATASVLFSLPSLRPVPTTLSSIFVTIRSTNIQEPIVAAYNIRVNTGAPITAANVTTNVVYLDGSGWLTADLATVGEQVEVRLGVDGDAVARFPDGRYEAFVQTIDLTGNYKRYTMRIVMTVDLE